MTDPNYKYDYRGNIIPTKPSSKRSPAPSPITYSV
jgi:hypothetical protein